MRIRLISMEAALLLGFFCGVAAFSYFKSATIRSIPSRVKNTINKDAPTPEPTPTEFCLDVPVLFYHHIQPITVAKERWEETLSVDPVNFERHIIYLKKQGYTFIQLSELVNALHERKELDKAIVLMTDDGYHDNYTYAFPIIKRQEIPFTIAMVTGFSGKISPYTKPGEPKEYEFMPSSEVKKMEDSGFVEFVNHSWSHQSLHQDNVKTIEEQVMVGEDQLKKIVTRFEPIFVYPYGRYGDPVISILKENNYTAAFSTDKGTKHCLSNMYRLPRLRVGNAGPSVYGF